MNIQEFNLSNSRKAKVNSDRAAKFRNASRRKDIVKRYLAKNHARVSSIVVRDNNVDTADFEFALNNIRSSISLQDKERFIGEAEKLIDGKKRSYDKILSDASLSSEDRNEIKKTRNDLIGVMQSRLDEAIGMVKDENVRGSEFMEPVNNLSVKEEEVSMNLESNVIRTDDLKNMTYVDYLCGVASSNGVSVRTIFESLVNGKKDVNVLTAEQFGGEKRGQVEAINQRIVEDKNRDLERQLINKNNELAASNEKVVRLEQKNRMSKEQNDQLLDNANNLRREKNSLEQNVFEQGNTISELNRRIGDLENQIKKLSGDNSRKQDQIIELQGQVRNLNSTIEDAKAENRRLKDEHSQYVNEKEAEILDLNEQLRVRDKERDNLSKILNGVTLDDYETTNTNLPLGENSDLNENGNNQEKIDSEKFEEVFAKLNKVMNGETYENAQSNVVRIH